MDDEENNDCEKQKQFNNDFSLPLIRGTKWFNL